MPNSEAARGVGGSPTPNFATGMLKVSALGQSSVLHGDVSDVGATRERVRQSRLSRLVVVLGLLAVAMWARIILTPDHPFGWPHIPSGLIPYIPLLGLVLLLSAVLIVPLLAAGRSPHVLYRPSQIPTRFSDVRGAEAVVEEATKTLNLFLAHKTFAEQMGGTPRRAVLFEGPPGTGKTFTAKAMAGEAGVPFLFVSSSAFQSMFYGQTNRKIRSFFRSLNRYARLEGGAIGFIEEIDAIEAARGGAGGHGGEGISGVVNELLIQLQSFDQPRLAVRVFGLLIDAVNGWLPPRRQLPKPMTKAPNVLVVGATNRAADLDPALLRPGRFDRSIYFGLPTRAGRREIIDYYLDRKSHGPSLDDPDTRDALAATTFGYSPVMIEHLLDEALVWALRRGAERLSWEDIQQAKMIETVGVSQGVEYVEVERQRIATHESGHACVAWLVGSARRLEVLSIVKRKDALGLLAHSDAEERFLQTRSELMALIQIALAGMVAEEIFFGETSSGVASDLRAATDATCHIVGAYGMTNSLVSYEALETTGRANLVAKVLGSHEGRIEVDRLLAESQAEVKRLIEANRLVVEALRDALIEHDELVGAEIDRVINAAVEGNAAVQI